MAEKKHGTAIEWTHGEGFKGETWNPVHGCSKVSPGCAHCYAETLSRRYKQTPAPWTPANAERNVILKPHKLGEPLKWREPRMVFVNSMSDLFHELVPDEYIAEVFSVMRRASQHTFQVLTKRPERMRDFVRRLAWKSAADPYLYPVGADAHAEPFGPPFVCQNVWLGVSIENRRFVHRADVLRDTPAAVRFISAEPLLGPLVSRTPCPYREDCTDDPWQKGDGECACLTEGDSQIIFGIEPWSLDLAGIDWLIVGGESGPGHRRLDLQWARDLIDACRASGTAPFVKQLGGARPGTKLEDLPEDLRIREYPAVRS